MAGVSPTDSGRVVFFDGECSLCNTLVQFVVRRDPTAQFRFASLQSRLGAQWSERAGVNVESAEATMLLVENGRLYARSEASLRVARRLGRAKGERLAWSLFAALGLALPRWLSDFGYSVIARNRRRLGFDNQACWLPNEELNRRLIG